MPFDYKPGTTLRVTVSRNITRASAEKTIERLFMTDDAIAGPIAARSRNFKAIPGRRGGRIWTKWPDKVHPTLDKGVVATLQATPQVLRDLGSVERFVTVEQG